MKITTKLVQGLNTISQTVGKHSPLILTVGGVVGLGATAIYSYKAAKKVEVIVEKIEDARMTEEYIASVEGTTMDTIEHADLAEVKADFVPVNRMEVAKELVGALALPVTLGIASITCIGLSYHIQNNRIGTLAAALATASAERAYFHSKYKKQHGEEEYQRFTTPTDNSKMTVVDAKGKEKEIDVDTKTDVPSLHGEWFDKSSEYSKDDHDYNMAFIRSVESNLQLKQFRKGFLLMNEAFDALGLPRTRAGALIGWSTGMGFDLYPEVTNCLNKVTQEIEPQIYVKWTKPTYIYETIEFDSVRGSI